MPDWTENPNKSPESKITLTPEEKQTIINFFKWTEKTYLEKQSTVPAFTVKLLEIFKKDYPDEYRNFEANASLWQKTLINRLNVFDGNKINETIIDLDKTKELLYTIDLLIKMANFKKRYPNEYLLAGKDLKPIEEKISLGILDKEAYENSVNTLDILYKETELKKEDK